VRGNKLILNNARNEFLIDLKLNLSICYVKILFLEISYYRDMKLLVILCVLCATTLAKDKLPKIKDKDMLRKMIIYDKVRCLKYSQNDEITWNLNCRKIQTFSTVQRRTRNTKFQLTRWLLSRHTTSIFGILSLSRFIDHLLLLELIQSANCANMREIYLRTVDTTVTRTSMRQTLHARRNIELWWVNSNNFY
jgi:hypothetical protein